MMPKRPVPDNLRELYRSNTTVELRRLLRCSQKTLYRWFAEAGIKTRKRGAKPVDTIIHECKVNE